LKGKRLILVFAKETVKQNQNYDKQDYMLHRTASFPEAGLTARVRGLAPLSGIRKGRYASSISGCAKKVNIFALPIFVRVF